MHPKWNEVQSFVEVIFFRVFSDKFREIWAKSFAHPKICRLLHL